MNKVELMDKKYKPKKKYHLLQLEQMTHDWLLLCDKYFTMIKDGRGKSKLRKSKRKMLLLYEISLIDRIIMQLSFTVLNKNLLPLSAFNGFMERTSSSVSKINPSLKQKDKESVYDWIARIRKYKDGLITRHSLSEKDLEDAPSISNDEDDVFYTEKAYLEEALDKNYIPEDICMSEWIIYKNRAFNKFSKNGN